MKRNILTNIQNEISKINPGLSLKIKANKPVIMILELFLLKELHQNIQDINNISINPKQKLKLLLDYLRHYELLAEIMEQTNSITKNPEYNFDSIKFELKNSKIKYLPSATLENILTYLKTINHQIDSNIQPFANNFSTNLYVNDQKICGLVDVIFNESSQLDLRYAPLVKHFDVTLLKTYNFDTLLKFRKFLADINSKKIFPTLQETNNMIESINSTYLPVKKEIENIHAQITKLKNINPQFSELETNLSDQIIRSLKVSTLRGINNYLKTVNTDTSIDTILDTIQIIKEMENTYKIDIGSVIPGSASFGGTYPDWVMVDSDMKIAGHPRTTSDSLNSRFLNNVDQIGMRWTSSTQKINDVLHLMLTSIAYTRMTKERAKELGIYSDTKGHEDSNLPVQLRNQGYKKATDIPGLSYSHPEVITDKGRAKHYTKNNLTMSTSENIQYNFADCRATNTLFALALTRLGLDVRIAYSQVNYYEKGKKYEFEDHCFVLWTPPENKYSPVILDAYAPQYNGVMYSAMRKGFDYTIQPLKAVEKGSNFIFPKANARLTNSPEVYSTTKGIPPLTREVSYVTRDNGYKELFFAPMHMSVHSINKSELNKIIESDKDLQKLKNVFNKINNKLSMRLQTTHHIPADVEVKTEDLSLNLSALYDELSKHSLSNNSFAKSYISTIASYNIFVARQTLESSTSSAIKDSVAKNLLKCQQTLTSEVAKLNPNDAFELKISFLESRRNLKKIGVINQTLLSSYDNLIQACDNKSSKMERNTREMCK